MDGSWESANEKMVKDWSVDEVLAMLKSIGLNSLVDTFRLNGVQGKDLVLLSDEDFKELGMSGLQIKKVKNLVQEHSKGANVNATVAANSNAPSSSGARQQINQPAGDGGYGIPPPLPAQPGPYTAGPPAGYPGNNMMMQQQMPYAGGAGYMPVQQQPQLQPPPASYGAGMPPPTYFPPPNFNQQQQVGGMMAPPPPNQQQQQGCCTMQ